MPNIALIISIIPVGTWEQDIKNQFFALQISTGFIGAGVDEIPPDELLPWAWSDLGLKIGNPNIRILARKRGTNVLKVFSGTKDNTLRTPILATGKSAQVKQWIKGEKTDIYWEPNTITGLDPSTNKSRLVESLTFLSTYPGSLSQELNLTHYFKVDDWDQLVDADEWDFIAAPIFNNTSPKEDFEFWQEDAQQNPKWTTGWQYNNSFLTYKAYAYVKPAFVSKQKDKLLFAEHLTNNKLDFESYWIKATKLDPISKDNNFLFGRDNNDNSEAAKNLPLGLAVQFGHNDVPSEDDPNYTPAKDTDIWRTLSGVGMLVKRKEANNKGWHLVSTAEIINKADTNFLFDNPALVPVRTSYKEEKETPGTHTRHLVIDYNQRSLIAPNPLADALNNYFNFTNQIKEEYLNPHYSYGPVLDRPAGGNAEIRNSLKLLPLKFGQKYQLALFMIDNAGGLPKKLSGNVPWTFDLNFINNSLLVPEQYVVDFGIYKRTSPVGYPRVTPTNPASKNEWPVIPKNVTPLALEVDPKTNQPDENGALESRPLVILYGDKQNSSFQLKLNPPTSNIYVLERWLTDKPHITKLWKDYLGLLAERQPRNPNDPIIVDMDKDISLDDPAVTSYAFKLERWDWKTNSWTREKEKKIDIIANNAQGIKKHQSEPLSVNLVLSNSWEIEDPNKNPVTVNIKRAIAGTQIVRFNVYALVNKDLAGLIDEKIIEKDPNLEIDDPAITNNYFVLKPTRIIIEAPTNELPTSKELWKAINLSILQRSVDVSLAFLEEQLPRFRNISRFDLLKQSWRWQGRTLPELPDRFASSQSTDKVWPSSSTKVLDTIEVLEWEVQAFASIDDQMDTLTIPVGYPKKLLTTQGNQSQIEIYKDKFDTIKQAQYLRYGIRVRSRYEGLFNNLTSVTSKQNEPIEVEGIGWKRAFLIYEGTLPLKPIIKAIIPLTQETQDNDPVPPLMLVLDETAFALCGITENLACQIEKAKALDNQQCLQYGYDPILRAEAYQQPANGDLMAEGPIGYTFDTGARQPLFSSSSYMVKPLTSTKPWDFAKIRFCRLSGNPTLDSQIKINESAWTKPQWVQFMPGAKFSGVWQGVEVTSNTGTPTKLTLHVKSTNDEHLFPSEPLPPTQRENGFTYVTLITKPIQDFSGRTGYEVYKGISTINKVDISKTNKTISFNLPTAIKDSNLLLRLVEIQLPPNTQLNVNNDNPEAFWKKLFFNSSGLENDLVDQALENREDECGRITRVSPPIPLNI